jgi:GAF domain-containing protein
VVIARTGPDGRLSPLAAAHPTNPETAAAMLKLDPYRLPDAIAATCRAGRTFALDPTPADLRVEPAVPGRHATLIAPLVAGARLVGLLAVICPGDHPAPSAAPVPPLELPSDGPPSGRFDHAEAELAEELARRIAVALEAERVAAREHRLNTAAAALATAATVAEAAAALAVALHDALEAGVVAVYAAAPSTRTGSCSSTRWG